MFFYLSGTFVPSNVAVGAHEYSRVIRRKLRFPAWYMSLDLQQWFLINVQLPRVFDILSGTHIEYAGQLDVHLSCHRLR